MIQAAKIITPTGRAVAARPAAALTQFEHCAAPAKFLTQKDHGQTRIED
jgi:hypothetical protein